MLIEHFKQGYSFAAFGGIIGVSEDTLHQWVKKYKDFSESKRIGITASLYRWEKIGLAASLGKIVGFNASTWIFNMKNRFGWRDKIEIDNNINDTTVENEKVKAMSKQISIFLGMTDGDEEE